MGSNPEGHSPKYWRKHQEARPSFSKKEESEARPQQRAIGQRLFGFVEEPLFLTAVSMIGALIGFIYTPVLAICGVCILVAFHKSKVVEGQRWIIKAVSYVGIFASTVSGLWGVGLLLKRHERDVGMTPVVLSTESVNAISGNFKGIVADLESRRPQAVNQNNNSLIVPEDSPNDPFSIEIENSAMLSDSREWAAAFWLRHRIASGEILSPANLVLFMRFLNKRAIKEYVDSYTVEMNSNGQWYRLRRLDTVGAQPYIAYRDQFHLTPDQFLKLATPMDFDFSGLDNQLNKKHALLDAGEVVRGWALFEYPPEIQRATGHEIIRITVKDMRGKASVHYHNRVIEEPDTRDRTLGNLLMAKKPKRVEDISGIVRAHLTDDPRIIESEQ